MMTLNPVLRIDTQMIEAVLAHEHVDRATARLRARDALGQVGISSPDERLKAYPHQFSGGMRQRVAIAIAFLNKPDSDHCRRTDHGARASPSRQQILHEAQKLCRETGTALIWITHDLTVVAGLAHRLCVMYSGRIVEEGGIDEVLDAPLHPYTKGLIESVPSRNRRGARLNQIPGMTPSPLRLASGCAFRERCPRAESVCAGEPEISQPVPGRQVRCFRPHLRDVP